MREQRALGADLGQRLLDALGDLGKALVEPRGLDGHDAVRGVSGSAG